MSRRGGQVRAATRRAGAAQTGIAAGTGANIDYFQRPAFYVWGLRRWTNSANVTAFANSAASGNKLRAIPHAFMRGGTIGRIGWFNNNAANADTAKALRWMIYADNSPAALYATRPGVLLWDSGSYTGGAQWTAGGGGGGASNSWREVTANYTIAGPGVYWLVYWWNSALGTDVTLAHSFRYYLAADAQGILGFNDPEVGVQGNAGIYQLPDREGMPYGYIHDLAYGAPPNPFPSSALSYVQTGAISTTNDPFVNLNARVMMFAFEWTPAVPT